VDNNSTEWAIVCTVEQASKRRRCADCCQYHLCSESHSCELRCVSCRRASLRFTASAVCQWR